MMIDGGLWLGLAGPRLIAGFRLVWAGRGRVWRAVVWGADL